MPRGNPIPFQRKSTGRWLVTIKGKQHNLGFDKEEAFKAYHRLMLEEGAPSPTDKASVVYLVDAFLVWLEENRAPSTYRLNNGYLQTFCKHVGARLRVLDLKEHHVDAWITKHYRHTSDSAKHTAIRAVQWALNWGVEKGYIKYSPVAKMEKPPMDSREEFLTPEQYETLRGLVKDREFLDILDILWETGCRPQEARLVEASYFDPAQRLWVFPRKRSKGKKRRRLVRLNDAAFAITQRLSLKHPEGPIFRNVHGAPWTADCLWNRFDWLKKKSKMDKLCAYMMRHGWATRMLLNGVDTMSVAFLMGHMDSQMVEKVYQHVDLNGEFLHEKLRKGTG